MPDVAELERAVDALLDAPLVTPMDASVAMTRGRARVRRRRGAGFAALAMTAAVAAAVVVVARPALQPNVRIGTRDEPTTNAVPVEHVSADGQFTATALPDDVTLHETVIAPNALALLPHVQSDYVGRSSLRVIVWTAPLDGPQPPEAQFAAAYRDLRGTTRTTIIDGRPAVVVTGAPDAANHPDQVFLYWFVSSHTVVALIGLSGTGPEQLERVALGLRAPSVSQPPGIYVVRDGVLTRQ